MKIYLLMSNLHKLCLTIIIFGLCLPQISYDINKKLVLEKKG